MRYRNVYDVGENTPRTIRDLTRGTWVKVRFVSFIFYFFTKKTIIVLSLSRTARLHAVLALFMRPSHRDTISDAATIRCTALVQKVCTFYIVWPEVLLYLNSPQCTRIRNGLLETYILSKSIVIDYVTRMLYLLKNSEAHETQFVPQICMQVMMV